MTSDTGLTGGTAPETVVACMYGFLRRPKWIAFHLVCIVASATMAVLGAAQILHLQDRSGRNDDISTTSHAPVAPLAELLSEPPDDVEYRRVEATGQYLGEPLFTVDGVRQDDTDGIDAVAVLRLDDGTAVVVVRGFVAAALSVPAPPVGEVHVTARLRRNEPGATVIDGPDGVVLDQVDLAAISAALGEEVAPMYLELLESDPDEPDTVLPIPFPDLSDGSHLRYALQWLGFSACVILGWWVLVRKRRNAPPAA